MLIVEKMTKMAHKIATLKRIDPKAIREKVQQECDQLNKKLHPGSKNAIMHCKQNFIKQQTADINYKMRELGLKLPPSNRLPNAVFTLTTENSDVDNKEHSVKAQESTVVPTARVILTNPEESRDSPREESSRVKKQQKGGKRQSVDMWMDNQQKLYNLIKACCQVQLEEVQGRQELLDLIFKRRIVDSKETEEVGLLRDLLRGRFAIKRSDALDSTLKKYYKRQNKFVSYRLFRDNYFQVVNNVLTVLESDER